MSKALKISILNTLALIILLLLAWTDAVKFPLLLSREWHRALHLTGIILFMGNMVVGPVWLAYAINTKDISIIRFALKLLAVTDLFLTLPGVDLTIINGLFLSSLYGGIKIQSWLFYSVILLFVMWILTIPVLYYQEKLYKSAAADDITTNNFKINYYLWSLWGTIVMLPPTVIFVFMVWKYLLVQ